MLSLNTDIAGLSMQRSLYNSTSRLSAAMKNLSSGLRINNASDDAANFVLSKNLECKTSGLSVANNNIKTAIGSLYTIDGYFKGIIDSLHRSRDLAVQSANAPFSSQERSALNENASEMQTEVSIAQSNANSETNPVSGAGGTGDFLNLVTQLDEAQAAANGYDENHIIRSASEFVSKISADLSGNFILTSGLNMAELGTLSDDAITGTFSGELDGNGYIVSNLATTQGSLFRRTSGAAIEDLGVENVNISSSSNSEGGIVGESSSTTISNCYATGSITGSYDIGGIVGEANNTTVTGCYSSGTVSGEGASGSNVGGIIGASNTSDIINSFSSSSITATNGAAGGLAGYDLVGSSIQNSYATGDVHSDTMFAGGLIGQAQGTITGSYATGDVSATIFGAGGLAGTNNGSVTDCYSTGAVSAGGSAGGLIGANTGSTTSSYWDVEKSGQSTSAGAEEGKTTAEMDAIIAAGSWPVFEVAQAPVEVGEGFSVQIGNDCTDESLYSLGDLSIDLSFLSVDLSTIASSRASLESIDDAINYMTEKRAYIGAGISSLEGITSSNQQKENLLESSNSAIRDADFGYDTSRMLKQQILQQSTISLMQQSAQINSQVVLGLLNF